MTSNQEDFLKMVAIVAVIAFVCWWWNRRPPAGGRRAARDASPLDRVIFWWGENDPLLRRDLLRSLCCLAASGAGKSSAFALQLGRALLRDRRVSLLILASKPEDKGWWQQRFAEAGRSGDLIIVEPGGPHRFNYLEYEARNGADSRDIAEQIMILGELLTRGDHSGAAHREPFWDQQNRRTLQNAAEIVLQATGKVDGWSLQTFIHEAAPSVADLDTERFRKSFHNWCLETAFYKPKTPVQQHDYELMGRQFWLLEWPAMGADSKMKQSILAGVLGLLSVFNSGIVRDMIGTQTSVSPDLLDQGQSILVNMPVANFGAAGAFVNGAWKYAVQRHILRRHAKPDSPLTCLWIDEYQNHLTSFDANKFLPECRSHHGCLVTLTQSLHSFFSALKGGPDGEHQTEALLSNFGHKVFMTLGDARSAKYAVSLIGNELQTLVDTSSAPPQDIWKMLWGEYHVTTSTHTSWQPILQDNVFLSGLRTGGPPDYVADAIVVRNGQPFAWGGSFLRCAFSQR